MKPVSINSRLSAACEIDSKSVSHMLEALSTVMDEALTEGRTIALPGFGEFSPVKTDEHVTVDADGRRMLMPPAINVEFSIGSALKKRLQ